MKLSKMSYVLMVIFITMAASSAMNQLRHFFPIAYATLIAGSTILHEGAHYVVATLLGGTPSTFTIIPKIIHLSEGQDAILYGSVMFNANSFNTAAISLAPGLLIASPGFFSAFAVMTRRLWLKAFWLYMAFCSWTSFTPSSQDMQNVLDDPGSWLVGAPVIFGGMVLSIVLLRKLFIKLQSQP